MSGLRYLYFAPRHVFGLARGFACAPPLTLGPVFPLPAPVNTPCPHVSPICSTGISTCCPSAMALALTLGPDLPRADQLYPGNLGYSANRIPTYFSLLIPAFSLPYSPLLLPVQLRPVCNAPLPTLRFRSFGSMFSPGHFRRRTSRLVSYYALFE